MEIRGVSQWRCEESVSGDARSQSVEMRGVSQWRCEELVSEDARSQSVEMRGVNQWRCEESVSGDANQIAMACFFFFLNLFYLGGTWKLVKMRMARKRTTVLEMYVREVVVKMFSLSLSKKSSRKMKRLSDRERRASSSVYSRLSD